MKEIQLTQGKVAIVDDEDYEWLSQWRWHYIKSRRDTGYASRSVRVGNSLKAIFMHRLIMETPDNMITDHINHDTLDNRRSNLRICTTLQNQWNRKLPITNTTGKMGIYWEEDRQKWRAVITKNYKAYRLGRFDSMEDAADAYDAKARELRGEFYNKTN
jgi:hypothetical protein